MYHGINNAYITKQNKAQKALIETRECGPRAFSAMLSFYVEVKLQVPPCSVDSSSATFNIVLADKLTIDSFP